MPHLCPYCLERPVDSEDHIFPEAIGGRRTIPSCALCNNSFGSTFEAKTIIQCFYPLLVMLHSSGVPVRDPGAEWKSAIRTEDGQVYNLRMGPEGFEAESTRPIVRQNDGNPKRFDVIVGDDAAGIKHLRKSFPEDKFRILQLERRRAELGPLKFNFSFGPESMRTATKMAFALAVIGFPREVSLFCAPRTELLTKMRSQTCPTCTSGDLRDHPSLDAVRGDLGHVVYVEKHGNILQGFVQFFGALQFHVSLATEVLGVYEYAVLATLDVLTGKEALRQIKPLLLPPFQPCLVDALLPFKKLNAAAQRCGARAAEFVDLKAMRVQVDGAEIKRSGFNDFLVVNGTEVKPYSPPDSTDRYMKK